MKNNNITIVTGLWDLGRGEMEGWGQRNFQQYKDRFFELLQTDANMVIWIPKDLEDEVLKIRSLNNTRIYIKEVKDFETWFPFFDEVQNIRNNDSWKNFAGWLPESPQASLPYYNPMMMCKMFMLHDTTIFNPFDSKYFYWLDGGITSTVNHGYFTNDNVLSNLDYHTELTDKFTFLTYPYTSNDEIHGFERKKMAEYCGVEYVDYISRGGFFGGSKKQINEINTLYYNILHNTLTNGYMGADECLFTILTYKYSDLIESFKIEGNGLVWPFFEYLKDVRNINKIKKNNNEIKTSLYVLTYNSPKQFETLLTTFIDVDNNFLAKPRKILINNSTDRTTDNDYKNLCEKYGFEEIKKDNIGICGGRQLVAEHFEDSDSDYYIFFEDDMNLHHKTSNVCKSGFMRYKENLFEKSLKIIHENNYDFLKLSFSEFYGDNSVQWAWYNVPQNIRDKFFPEKNKLPIMGLDPNPPKTSYKEIKCLDDLPYVEGEVHYCNWPLWMGKEGNKKVFINTKWQSPQEQTWMSFVFQLQKEGVIKSGILLLSPIDHERFDYYPATERREN
jgi:hypothetical protein